MIAPVGKYTTVRTAADPAVRTIPTTFHVGKSFRNPVKQTMREFLHQ